jgi:hypothetical protein
MDEDSANDAECVSCSKLHSRDICSENGSSAPSATTGAVKSVQAQTTGKHLYTLFAAPSKYYA